jgi:AraC family transcriptional regulator
VIAVPVELGLRDTNGILRQPWIRPERTSRGLGWDRLYLSTQHELPYQANFAAAGTHVLILHLSGPVTVRRGRRRLTAAGRIPAGGLFLHPAGRDLAVELGGELDTVHAYLPDAIVQEATETDRPVELAEELGTADPLLEQLLLTLDGVVRRWEPAGRTYVDHLGGLLAAHLARRHSVARGAERRAGPAAALSARQLAEVRELMTDRLAEPLPLTELAAATGLSVSQFARRFRAGTGVAPHQYLIALRVEQACRLLRAGRLPIAQIAAASGFSHQEHLSRVLRARLGATPAQVRRAG